MGIFPAADIGALQASAVLTLLVRGKAGFGGEMSIHRLGRKTGFWLYVIVAKALFLFSEPCVSPAIGRR